MHVQVVVLLIKPIVFFFAFSLLSASLDLKVPNDEDDGDDDNEDVYGGDHYGDRKYMQSCARHNGLLLQVHKPLALLHPHLDNFASSNLHFLYSIDVHLRQKLRQAYF